MKSLLLCLFLLFSQSLLAVEKLRLISEQIFPTGEKFKETEIGGLSGISFDLKKNKLIAISDDRSAVNNARFYEFEIFLSEKNFSVKPSEVFTLKTKEGNPFPKMTTDFEGISLWGDQLLITSEGGLNREPLINPSLNLFSREGLFKESIEIPSHFLSKKGSEMSFGSRDNLNLESLSSTPDGKFFFLATEESLLQDGRITNHKTASTVRIVLFNNQKPIKEFGYTLETVPAIPVGGLTVGETGLVDIAAIDENNFYTIERSYLPLAKKTIVRLFKNHVDEKTTNILNLDAIKKESPVTVIKTLIANFDDFIMAVDNIEGVCFGPNLSNGHQTLIFVSDNNFSKSQKTQFMALEIIP